MTSDSKKIWIIIAGITLLIAICIAGYYWLDSKRPKLEGTYLSLGRPYTTYYQLDQENFSRSS